MAGWTTDPTTAGEIAAALAGSADQITQLNALANALGTGPRTMTVKWAATGDPWNGSIVFQGTLTGANVVSAGKLRPGQVTAHGVATAVNMGPGSAVLRIANASGRYVQMPIGVAAGGVSLPRNPAGLFAMVLGDTFGIAADPSLATAPDMQLTTLALRNTGGTEQAADFVTPSFGHAFVQGQIPVGTYPHFRLASGATCPATIWGETSWPDGSMRFCCAMLIVPTEIAVSGTLVVQVRSGGSKPAASTRTLAEVSAVGLSVELNVTTPAEGTYTAPLNDAVARNADIAVYADGPAGKIWRVGDHARNGSDAEHGQIYVRHYVMALSNGNGSLRGFRHLARVAQPFVAGNVPEARTRVLSCTVKSAVATIRALQGHNDTEAPGPDIAIPHYGSIMTAGADARYDYLNSTGAIEADATVQVVTDMPYAQSTGFIPPSIRGGTAQSGVLNYYPMGRGGMERYMPNTGGRDDIGLITAWCARYIAHPSETNERALRVNTMASSGWRTACWKRETLNIVAVSDTKPSFAGLGTIQTTWRNHSTGTGFQRASPNTSLWTEDDAHRPNLFLVAYFATGEPHLLDLCVDNGAFLLGTTAVGLKTITTTRPTKVVLEPGFGERDVRVGTAGETIKHGGSAFIGGRIGAWRTRDTAVSSAICPDVMPDGSEANVYLRDATRAATSALAAYAETMPESHRNDGLFILQPDGPGDREYESPWQIAFWNLVICWVSSVWKTSEATTARRYFLRRYVRAHELFDVSMLASYRMAQFDHEGNMITSMQQYVGNMTRQLNLDGATNTITVVPGSDPVWNPTNGDVVAFSSQYTHADIGSTIAVEVSYKDGLGEVKKLTSQTTGAIIAVNDPAASDPVTITAAQQTAGLPRLEGTLAENQVITVDVSTITDPNGMGPFTYQWLRNGSKNGDPRTTGIPYQIGGAHNPFPALGRNRRLYVVNASGFTFQLATTPGGAPLDILRSVVVLNSLIQPKNVAVGFWPAPGSDYPTSTFGALSYHTYHQDPGAETVKDFVEQKLVAWGGNPNAVHQHNFAAQ